MQLTPQMYRQIIIHGIQGLPSERLAEVANFVVFLHKQATEPDTFAIEQYTLLLDQELTRLDTGEWQHLETEITDYEAAYPHE